MNLTYHLVDVFTQTPLEGNALAVFTDATGMSADLMQRVAREMNLSETAFILPAESTPAATRVRIFTPTYEMAFAGHPTIGTAWVMRALGIVSADAQTFELAENVGNVRVRVDANDDLLWLTTPPITTLETFDRAACAAALSLDESDLLAGLPCELRTAGNPNIYVPLRDAQTVDRATIDSLAFARLVASRNEATCIFPFTPTPFGAYSRMFSPELGVVEDPATGSATGPLAQYMMAYGLAAHHDGARYYSEQGTKMGRRSILHITIDGEHGERGIDVGGQVTPIARGEMRL